MVVPERGLFGMLRRRPLSEKSGSPVRTLLVLDTGKAAVNSDHAGLCRQSDERHACIAGGMTKKRARAV